MISAEFERASRKNCVSNFNALFFLPMQLSDERDTGGMIGLLCFVLAVLASPFKSKIRLEAENAVLRHQLVVLRRRLHGRARLTNHDRWFFIQLYRRFPSVLKVLTIIRPETVVRWHRAGFRGYWH